MNAGTATARPFFQLNAQYNIAPGAQLPALVEDALLLVMHALGVLDTIAEEVTTEGYVARANGTQSCALWGGVYLLRQARDVLSAAASDALKKQEGAA